MFRRFTEPRRRVVFHLKSGESVEGVLYPSKDWPKGHYLLGAARLREDMEKTVPLAFGDVTIPASNVIFYEAAT